MKLYDTWVDAVATSARSLRSLVLMGNFTIKRPHAGALHAPLLMVHITLIEAQL